MKELKFNPEMQIAIDEGRKTQTRRVVKTDSEIIDFVGKCENKRIDFWKKDQIGKFVFELLEGEFFDFCPYGIISDTNNGVLITDIRVERLNEISKEDAKAEGIESYINIQKGTVYRDYSIIPNMFSFDPSSETRSKKFSFQSLWQSIYKDHPKKDWTLNPWVWVITFEQVNN